jgi:hypothetical protein
MKGFYENERWIVDAALRGVSFLLIRLIFIGGGEIENVMGHFHEDASFW